MTVIATKLQVNKDKYITYLGFGHVDPIELILKIIKGCSKFWLSNSDMDTDIQMGVVQHSNITKIELLTY